jgi:hypothetical protein
MGLVYADIELSNPRRDDLKSLKVKSLVDTGAVMLCLPEHLVTQLDLDENGTRDVSTADGRSQPSDWVMGNAVARRTMEDRSHRAPAFTRT